MFPILPTIAQTPPAIEILQPGEVRPLPGELDTIPVFNSNSPELVLNEGILLSTFPGKGKASPNAHLNYAFRGKFDVFAHHVARANPVDNLRTLYLGVLLHNPGREPVTVEILRAASYLSQPDAPFIPLSERVADPDGRVFSGPGSRVMGEILRGRREEIFPEKLVIPPGESRTLVNLPIPVKDLTPPLNGRSTYLRLDSNGTLYAASLALYAPLTPSGEEKEPSLEDWRNLLENGDLATPRDRAPTPPGSSGQIIYGRVAGVALGSVWRTRLVDRASLDLRIPEMGRSLSYGIATLEGGKLGTEQSQSAPMIVRYPDTAYKAHGNYGIEYNLALPLFNPTASPRTVTLSLQTPIKQDEISDGLRFLDPLPSAVFFRGSVRVNYTDDSGQPREQYFHLVQKRGDPAEPIVTLTIPPNDRRVVNFDFLYPPDATPPQVLTIQTVF
jgi:hypothetical protein